MSEIINDLKLTTLEINSSLGINLTGNTTRIKHTGTGTFNIESTQGSINFINNTGEYIFLGSDSSSAKILLYEDTRYGTNSITLQSPSSLNTSYTLTLPENDGNANQYLSTDGNGTLSWNGSNKYTRTVVNSSTYTVLITDEIIAVRYTSTGTCTVTLPSISSLGEIKISVVDEGGNSGNNNITIAYASGNYLFGLNGSSNVYLINSDYSSVTLYNDGSINWYIYT